MDGKIFGVLVVTVALLGGLAVQPAMAQYTNSQQQQLNRIKQQQLNRIKQQQLNRIKQQQLEGIKKQQEEASRRQKEELARIAGQRYQEPTAPQSFSRRPAHNNPQGKLPIRGNPSAPGDFRKH